MRLDIEKILARATGGNATVPDDWMPATGMRPLQQDDAGLLWLKFHGDDEGFERDATQYAFTPFIAKKGQEFERVWIKKEAPGAVRAMEQDWHVRQASSFRRTLELIQAKTPVIAKAALWWKDERIYGSADLICLTSWLDRKFLGLRTAEDKKAPDHYVILDMKFTSNLHTYSRRHDLEKYACQMRIYSYALGHIQDFMPKQAYIITRDWAQTQPITVEVKQTLGKPLDKQLRDYRNEYRRIKLRGERMKPWKDKEVAVNPNNAEDYPWHGAKEEILTELVKGQSLTMLPGVGNKLADALEDAGYECLADLLAKDPADIPLEDIPGIGAVTAGRIRAVLEANKRKKSTPIPLHLVPSKMRTELFIDCEYLSNINCDMEKEWPHLQGTPMIAVIGAGWQERGKFQYRQFFAESESALAEKRMLQQFANFLEERGALDGTGTTALYCWSNAEKNQMADAVERHPRALKDLADLPWYDLLDKVFYEVPIGIPGAWKYDLKEVSNALSAYSEKHANCWPEGLNSGQAAQVALWDGYAQERPLESEQFALVARYLEADVRALWCILNWLRDSTKEELEMRLKTGSGSWYSKLRSRPLVQAGMTQDYQPKTWYALPPNKLRC